MVVYIVGPTASGKTTIALELAKKIPAEIISADSRQIYKYLSIGTSKPKGTWKNIDGTKQYLVYNTPYHLVDFLNPDKIFSAGDFVSYTEKFVKKIRNRQGKIPLIVGGSGLYIHSFIYGLTELPKSDQFLRSELISIEKKYGRKYLHNKLAEIDSISAEKIHPKNIQRIIRALEVYYLTGKPISYWWQKKTENKKPRTENHLLFGLYWPREILYDRINKRAEEMLQNGIIEETKKLLKNNFKETCPAFQSAGYKYVILYLKNQISHKDLLASIQKDHRNYAKRQITWFKRYKNINWIDCTKTDTVDFINSVTLNTMKGLKIWKKLSQ